jgi:hypothetical protein
MSTPSIGRPELTAQDFLATLMERVRSVSQWLRMPAPGVPEASAELLRLAALYEPTQPSYAADLRAAASVSEREEG